MHCTTAVVSPACTLYRPGPRRPSLNVSCHFLSLSSKLMYRSAWIAVSCSGRAIWVVDISILLGNRSLKPSFLAQSLPIEPAPHSIFHFLNIRQADMWKTVASLVIGGFMFASVASGVGANPIGAAMGAFFFFWLPAIIVF